MSEKLKACQIEKSIVLDRREAIETERRRIQARIQLLSELEQLLAYNREMFDEVIGGEEA